MHCLPSLWLLLNNHYESRYNGIFQQFPSLWEEPPVNLTFPITYSPDSLALSFFDWIPFFSYSAITTWVLYTNRDNPADCVFIVCAFYSLHVCANAILRREASLPILFKETNPPPLLSILSPCFHGLPCCTLHWICLCLTSFLRS